MSHVELSLLAGNSPANNRPLPMVVSRSHQKSLMPAGIDARHHHGHSNTLRSFVRGTVRTLAQAQVRAETEGEDDDKIGLSEGKPE